MPRGDTEIGLAQHCRHAAFPVFLTLMALKWLEYKHSQDFSKWQGHKTNKSYKHSQDFSNWRGQQELQALAKLLEDSENKSTITLNEALAQLVDRGATFLVRDKSRVNLHHHASLLNSSIKQVNCVKGKTASLC
jgi:hypothetical protein